jgi:hypothetical protein
MPKQILAVSAAIIVATALAGSAAAFASDGVHKSGFAASNGLRHRVAMSADDQRRHRRAWGHPRLPFGPVLGALYSYGSGHACNPHDPFTDLYGYCGGRYNYRW